MNLKKKAVVDFAVLFLAIITVITSVMIFTFMGNRARELFSDTRHVSKDGSDRVATGFQVVEAYGHSEDLEVIDYWVQRVKVQPGSPPIKIEDTFIHFFTNNDSEEYIYSSAVNCSNITSMQDNPTNFGFNMQIQGNNYLDGYINDGEIAKICFNSPTDVIRRDFVQIKMIPSGGQVLNVEGKMPYVWQLKNVVFFP